MTKTLEKPYQPDKALLTKAASKWLSLNIAYKLCDFAKTLSNPDESLIKQFNIAKSCCSVLTIQDQKITAKYCGYRFCIVCNRIRSAKISAYYNEQLQNLENLTLLTLTVPNVSMQQLTPTIKTMNKIFIKIKDQLRKKGITIHGLKKIEVTYNQKRNDYHPHFHILIQNTSFRLANTSNQYRKFKLSENKNQVFNGTKYTIRKIYLTAFIKRKWCKLYHGALPKSQDSRPADANSIRELAKYFTKIFQKCKATQIKSLDLGHFYNILYSIKSMRMIQPFGSIKAHKDVETIKDLNAQQYSHIIDHLKIEDVYLQELYYNYSKESICKDWMFEKQYLSDYIPTIKTQSLIENIK